MISWISGAGAFGAAIGVARAEKLAGATFAAAVLFALVAGAAVLWLVWRLGAWLLSRLAARKAIPAQAEWSRVLPPMYILLFAGFTLGGIIGGVLTYLLIHYGLR